MSEVVARSKREVNGFSLVETIIAIAIISVGLLSLAAALASTIVNSDRLKQVALAKYIAVSTMESIIAAREAEIISFSSIDNIQKVVGTSYFPPEPKVVKTQGIDRIFGTQDDDQAADLIYTVGPGEEADGYGSVPFDGQKDQRINLTQLGYRRQITINNFDVAGNPPTARRKEVRIEVFYPAPVGGQRSFVLTTNLGNYRINATAR